MYELINHADVSEICSVLRRKFDSGCNHDHQNEEYIKQYYPPNRISKMYSWQSSPDVKEQDVWGKSKISEPWTFTIGCTRCILLYHLLRNKISSSSFQVISHPFQDKFTSFKSYKTLFLLNRGNPFSEALNNNLTTFLCISCWVSLAMARKLPSKDDFT